ncbi:Diacetyl reductase [(S)-acetoin forming] [Psilocybe cubensis]|uniref:NAD(P)-binding protein n=2 Tax=Psilocybe cubensis TaxID=181762 RepID=A0A8H8CIZ8_PSICU|nr:Diacetyl reductase [(S)-acetoin forming] [Psilocybe cubensis]KAH9479727.1 Diacetyl reductase [(S)-acetoin forming] [Psilocybe cubensis]
MSKLVAFILGAGTHVGAAVAAKLHKNGYQVALGSRNPKQEGSDGTYFNVKLDVQSRESIESAFDTVVKNLGPVNVVVYNAASRVGPTDPNEFLSVPIEAYQDAASIGVGGFIAAHKALASFRSEVHKENPKVFIVTGNLLPFEQYNPPGFFTLGAQKALLSRFVATASQSYQNENIQFYYATQSSETGTHPGPENFAKGAQAHADVYWKLINNKKQGDWNHQFTLDGKAYPHA